MRRLGALYVVLISMIAPSPSAGQELVRLGVLEGLSLMVPRDFIPMPYEMISLKYPGQNRPAVVFMNRATTVNIAVRHTNVPLLSGGMERALLDIKTGLLSAMPGGRVNYDGVVVNGDREWFSLDFSSQAIDTEIRNLIVGTSFRDRLLMISFNCTRELEDEWVASGKKIVMSAEFEK
jgi:hypothetical protein